ncbi:hypothetical protein D3C78_987540 [compost metagenome]
MQGALALFTSTDQMYGRDQNHHQDWQEPQRREDPQGFLDGAVLQAIRQGAIADQMRHWPSQFEHQHGERQRGQQAGHSGDTAGDITAQLPGNLRAGQGIAPGGEKTDHEQRSRCHRADDPYRSAFVPGVEQGDQTENDRRRENTATGGVSQAHAQCAPGGNHQEVTDVERHDQAGQGG